MWLFYCVSPISSNDIYKIYLTIKVDLQGECKIFCVNRKKEVPSVE